MILATGRMIFVFLITGALLISCKEATSPPDENVPKEGQGNHRGKRPDADTLIERMDADNDGKLSKDEIKGPLAEHFSNVDLDSDGFLTKEELIEASKNQQKPPKK